MYTRILGHLFGEEAELLPDDLVILLASPVP